MSNAEQNNDKPGAKEDRFEYTLYDSGVDRWVQIIVDFETETITNVRFGKKLSSQ